MRLFAVLTICLALSAPAAAEGFIDIYTGGAFTENDRVSTPGLLGSSRRTIDFDESALLGIRGGAWGEGRLPFIGGAIDISGFSPDLDGRAGSGDLAVIPHSLLILFRIPLVTSDEFPTGQIHPYAGVGPSLVVSRLDIDAGSSLASALGLGGGIDDTEVDLGVDARGGLDVLLTRHFGLFAEYRFTHFRPTYSDGGRRLSLDLDTHFIQGGLTFRFGS